MKDWGSRYYVNGVSTNIFDDKPCAVMSAGGTGGGHLAQYCVRQSCVFLNVRNLFVLFPCTHCLRDT